MIFKKRPENAIPLDKLKMGTLFTCNTLQWEIIEISRYDWSMDGHSIEYKLISTDTEQHEAFVEIERVPGKYEILFYEEVTIEAMQLLEASKNGTITYLDETFKQEEHYTGSVKNETFHTAWKPVESFIFYDQNDAMLSIEKNEDDGCKAFYGFELNEESITKVIVP